MFAAPFPHYRQLDQMDCGPTCLRIVAKYYGKNYRLDYLRELCYIDRSGVSMYTLSHVAEKIGFRTRATQSTFEKLAKDAPLPLIALWKKNHFIVVYKIKNDKVYVSDPESSRTVYSKAEFIKHWASFNKDGKPIGLFLLLDPRPEFHKNTDVSQQSENQLGFLADYLRPYRAQLLQLVIGVLVGSLISLTLPFLTQSLVDLGINYDDPDFIYVILMAQLMMFTGRTAIQIIRARVLLHITNRVNIAIVSDFLIKLMSLPLSYFERKNTGDLLQRIRDHKRIEDFLTSTSIEVLFSIFSFMVFGLVLWLYSFVIFSIFLAGTLLYIFWILLFMKKRRDLDFRKFKQQAENQNSEIELIRGMQEIKLQNCEKQKRWEWENIQAQLHKINIKSLALAQMQGAGATFINEVKNILITFWAAHEVIQGNMTLGMMLSVSYITGQLNAPVLQFLLFTQQWQDAKISLERLAEIHNLQPEASSYGHASTSKLAHQNIYLDQLYFRYGDRGRDWVLKNVTCEIPFGKTTAIVGTSGSGKTTLLKLLLMFYDPEQGYIHLGKTPYPVINKRQWRSRCGIVMQDGYMFSDSILRNIVLGEDYVDQNRLMKAVEIANIRDFIESLPHNYQTKIGGEGVGMSEGQKQRILIARAVYKSPEYLFFDEATSALDANNETAITQHLDLFLKGKTAVIIAHRLSTVKNADQILVIDQGEIKERGTHKDLVAARSLYYELVKNQLELGN